jgi:hypothetical protein
MRAYAIEKITENKNAGIAREWAICNFYGVNRTHHDNVRYDKGSDLDIGNMHMSIKASKFTLMAGSLCEGHEDFDGIWTVFETHVHSNVFVYVTENYIAYEMNIHEFKRFVYAFATLTKESDRNGGYTKIQCRKESHKMLQWLEANMAA